MFGAVCRSTGKVLFQPLKKKSEAKIAITAFLALVRRECSLIQIHLRRWDKSFRLDGMVVVSTDLSGEFTCTNGYTESQVDVLLRDVAHLFNTPGMPQSGTSRIERFWRTLSTVARCHLYTAVLCKPYYFDAVAYAGGVYNDSPTSANKFGDGAARNASLGLSKDSGVYLPFGALAHHRVRGVKTDDKNGLVVNLGLNQDGTGYSALRVSDDPGGSVFVSQDIKAHPDLSTARSLPDQVNAIIPYLGFVRRAALQPRGYFSPRGRGGARWPPRNHSRLAGGYRGGEGSTPTTRTSRGRFPGPRRVPSESPASVTGDPSRRVSLGPAHVAFGPPLRAALHRAREDHSARRAGGGGGPAVAAGLF